MTKVLVFGPTEHSHVKKWNSFFYGCELSLFTLHIGRKVNRWSMVTRFIRILINTSGKKYDIAHVHFASSYGVLFNLLLVKCNTSLVSIWGSDFNRFFDGAGVGYQFWSLIISWSLKRYDLVNVPSTDIYQKVRKLGVHEDKIILMQYGIRTKAIDKIKSKSKVINVSNRFISIRNFADLYNIEILVDAFASVAKEYRFELQIIGTGTPEECSKIENLLANYSDDRIQFIGFVSSSELTRLLIEAEYFVSIPSMDGLSLVVLESIACGCKGIVSNIPAYQDKLFDRLCWRIDHTDASRFTDLLEEIISRGSQMKYEVYNLDKYDIAKNRVRFRKFLNL